jgi:hypothetical protein
MWDGIFLANLDDMSKYTEQKYIGARRHKLTCHHCHLDLSHEHLTTISMFKQCEYRISRKFVPHVFKHKKVYATALKISCPWNSKRPIYSDHSIQWLCYLYIFNKILIIFFHFVLSICIFFMSHHYPLENSLYNNDNQINNYKWETTHNWMDSWKRFDVNNFGPNFRVNNKNVTNYSRWHSIWPFT